MNKPLVISNSKELYRLPCDNIAYVAGDGDYSEIYMTNGAIHNVTMQLGKIVDLLEEIGKDDDNFPLMRIGKSRIINKNYVTHIYPAKKKLKLCDYKNLEITIEASVEALTQLKKEFE